MYKTANEIALEQKVKELEKEIELGMKFETAITMKFTMILFAMLGGDSGAEAASKAFDEIRVIISDRAKYHILKSEKKG